MNGFTVYVLHSIKLNLYYTGHTRDLMERVARHNSGQSVFTSRANDWKLVYQRNFATRTQASVHEKRIKKTGAPKFLRQCGMR